MSSSSGKFDLNGWPVWFERFGTGNDVILLIPGAMGTGRSDFKEQLEGPNAFDLKKYTIVAIELPGWGRSRPPQRPYGIEVYDNDTDCALKLMDNLGYKSYSIIGWSDGAKVALMMCYLNPIRIKSVVAIGIFVWASKETVAPMLFTRDTKKWPKEKFNSFIQVYGDEYTLQLLWDQHINFCKDFMNNCGEGKYIVTSEQLAQIRTPVLLIHGDKDPLIGLEHPIYCKTHIPGSTLHRFPEGSHNCHGVFAAQFKELVKNFFENCENSF